MLKRLTDPSATRGKTDAVLLDSPEPLSPRQPYPAARIIDGFMAKVR